MQNTNLRIRGALLSTLISAAILSPAHSYAQNKGYEGSDPLGTVSYALPQTSLRLEVEAVQETFYAGPYARYAQKYLGIDVRRDDAVSWQVTRVGLSSFTEADQSRRFILTPGKGSLTFLSMTTQGLVSLGGASPVETSWRFPSAGRGDFSGKGVSSALTSEAATLYRNVKKDAASGTVAVHQQMVVEKSPETRAKEAAETIFELRRKRLQIVTGDTDATFSGEALGAALDRIEILEKEYMSMFTGYSEYQTQKMNYEVVPSRENKNQLYVAFRLSDSDGLVAADNLSGKPYLLELAPQPVDAPAYEGKPFKGQSIYYRIPSVCTVKLSDGVKVLLQSRIPLYQLGAESSFPFVEK